MNESNTLDLEAVDTDTLLGSAFVDGYRKDPTKAVKEISEAYRDNPEMVEEVIGKENMKIIL